MSNPLPFAQSPARVANRRGVVGLLTLGFVLVYCLAVVPVWVGWVRSTAELGGAPESLFLAGLFTMFALGLAGFILVLRAGGSDDPIVMGILMVAFTLGSIMNASRVWGSPELRTMRAYNSAQAVVTMARGTLGHAPPVASELAFPSLSAALSNSDPVFELALADASAATVSQAMTAIQATGDESNHAKFVRDNAIVRPEDQAHFAQLAVRAR